MAKVLSDGREGKEDARDGGMMRKQDEMEERIEE